MTPQTGVFVITKSQNYPKRRIFAFQKCGRKTQGLHMHSGGVKTSGLRGYQSAIFWTTFLGVTNDTSGPAANTSANMTSTDSVSGYIFGVRKFRNPRCVCSLIQTHFLRYKVLSKLSRCTMSCAASRSDRRLRTYISRVRLIRWSWDTVSISRGVTSYILETADEQGRFGSPVSCNQSCLQ